MAETAPRFRAILDLDTIIETILTTSRVFVAIAGRDQLGKVDTNVTLPQFRLLIVLAAHGPQGLGALAEFLAVQHVDGNADV